MGIKINLTGNISCATCGLSSLCIPRGLNEREVHQLDKLIDHNRHYERNNYLYQSGETMQAVYAVRSGSFKIKTSNSDGTEQVLGFYFPGDLIGLEGFANQQHSCDVVALESASVCRLSSADLDLYCGKIPNLRRELMLLLGREITNSNRMLLALGKMTAEEKIAAFLVDTSYSFSQRGFSSTELNLTMSRHDIANYLGITIETVSRLLSRMQKSKLIEVKHRNVCILDLEALQNMAPETRISKYIKIYQSPTTVNVPSTCLQAATKLPTSL